MTWPEILSNPEWSKLSTPEQAQVRAEWLDKYVVPEWDKAGIPRKDIEGLRQEANQTWDNGVGAVKSFGNAAAQGFLNTGTSAVQGAGVLVGSDELEQVGREAEASVNETFRINPTRENTNLVGNVLGNVGAFLGTAGVGGAIGKGAGVAKLGAEIGGLGTGGLAGAGQGAQDADRYGITGGARYARALGGGAVEVLSELAGGTGAEMTALRRLGMGSITPTRTGGFLHALGTESGEEVLAQMGGNALNTALAPPGVKTPGIMSGTLQAAAGGAIGGAMFGGINALGRTPPAPGIAPLPPVAPPPSETITRAAQQQALASGDPAAAAAMQAMQPNTAPPTWTGAGLQPIQNPLPNMERDAEIPFDPTLNEEFTPPEPLPTQEAAPMPEPPLAPPTQQQAPLELPQLPLDAPFLINNAPPIGEAAPAAVEEPALPPGRPATAPPQQDDGPELDLFGEPIEPDPGTSSLAGLETQEIPVDQITLSPDVPQFKEGADKASGVVEQLGGKFERLGVGPILLWRRNNGKLEVISGRHRLDLARRSGEKTIPSQIVDEAAGFTRKQALTADAELNIRDEKGTVKDFANYFRNSQLGTEEAEQRGLLSRAQGRAGFAIGRNGTDALFDLHQNSNPEKFSDKAAEEIANAAPGDEGLQRIGMSNVLAGHPINFSVNMMRAAQASMAGGSSTGQQLDLFGSDDTAMETMRRQAKNATSIQNRIREQISAVRGAAKRPDLAAKLGVNVNNPVELKSTLERLSAELERWQNWPMHPDLVAQTREDATGGITVQQSLNLPPVQPARASNDGQNLFDMSVSPNGDVSTLAWKLRPAYDRLVERNGTDSVFISDLVNESGLPLPQVQQWLRDYGINQGQATLDTGDWSHATEEQRAANVMLRDQERLYVRLHPGVGTGPAPAAQQQAPPQSQPATLSGASLKERNPKLWDEGAARLFGLNYTGNLDQGVEELLGPNREEWIKRNTKPSQRPVTERKKLLAWSNKARAWNSEQQRTQADQSREAAPQRNEPSVFDRHGRIAPEETQRMAEALKGLGVTRANIVINDTGFAPGETNTLSGVKGQRVTDANSDTIYLNRNKVTADTPAHEVFHGLIPELKAQRPDLHQQGIDLIRNSPALAEIRAIYEPLGHSEERMMEEALVTVLGNESPAWLRKYAGNSAWFQALQRWIAKVRVWMTDTFGKAGIDPDMTLREFAKDINRRVLSGQLKETGLRQQQAAALNQEDLSANPNRQEPGAQIIRPSGLSENQPGNPTRAMVADIHYRGESAEQAMAQASAIYNDGQQKGWDFQQHLGMAAQILERSGGIFNMTYGAYTGLMAHGLAIMRQDTSLSVAEREAAKTNLRTLMEITAAEFAAGGQFVKGADLFLRLMADPEIQVENMSMRAAVGGEQAALKEFRVVARMLKEVMAELQNEALRTIPQEDATDTVERIGGRLSQGDDAALEGELAIEEELQPEIDQVEREALVTDQDWFKAGVAQMSARVQALVDEWLVTLEALSLKNAGDSDFSLSPTERSAKAAELAKNFTRDQLRVQAENLFKRITSRQKVEMASPSGPQDVGGMVKDRLTKNLNRLLNGKAKKTKSTHEKIAEAIANVLLAKAGHNTTIPAGQDALVFAMGLALSNQQLAKESVSAIHAALQANPDTKDAISQEKLKGFMSLMTGQDFSAAHGEAAPYGEKQIATLLKRELEIQNTTLAQSVRSAALQGRTVEQLEANLRDPFRGLTDAFEPAVLDRIVNAVKAQYTMSAAQRAQAMADRQAARDATEGAVREARQEQREKRLGMERAKRKQEQANERVLREQARAQEMEVRKASAEERKQLARDLREARNEQRQKRQAFLRAEKLNQEALDRAEQAELRKTVAEARRDAMERKRAHLRAERNNRTEERRARVADMRKKGTYGPEARLQELTYEEQQKLLKQPKNRVIDYLSREFGFNVNDIVEIARGEDRQATLEQRVLELADQLGLTKEQAEEFMKPVVAAAMKRVDAKRLKEAEKKIKDAIDKLEGNFARKAKKQPTAVQRLRRLMELGGLDVTGIEKVLLNSVDAKEFTPEFKEWLKKMVARSNDTSLPQTERDNITMAMQTAIRSEQGGSLIGLFGEWTMSNIFCALNTFKVNAVWGGVKAMSDSVLFANVSLPSTLKSEYGIETKGLSKALMRRGARAYSKDMRYHMLYMFKTGRSPLEQDYTTRFEESEFELLAQFPDTVIRMWLDGKPLPPFWANKVKFLAKYSKFTRRTMVATDLLHRNQAHEMLKAAAIVKLIAEQGRTIPNTEAGWTQAIDDAMYGGSFEAAKEDAYRQADDDIAAGRARKEERGILFGEYLDKKLGESLGVSETQRREILDDAALRARRWTNADQLQGVLGVLSTAMMELAQKIPGLKFLMPAIRMPINTFSQGLDYSPYGFLRWATIKQSGNKSSSFSHLAYSTFNPKLAAKYWHMPANGISSEEAIEMRTKAMIGTALMVALFALTALDWDEDDDDATFYITGRGPTDPQKAKLWKERGYRPFMIRIGGITANYQESPAFAPLAVLGATSDANRYGAPDDTKSDKLAYAITRSMGAFADAAVLRNLQDVLAGVTGNQTYNPKQAGSWTSRLAGVAVFPRIGSEVNTILWGPQATKELGWGARALANVPFIPAITNKPAMNWFGEEIHAKRDGPLGEALPLLMHRIAPIPLDDEQMSFVAKMGAAPLQTRKRLKNGDQVMEDYDLMRKWAASSGKALRKYFTPEVMARHLRNFARDRDQAEKDFDSEVREIRENELAKLPNVVF